MTAIRAILPYQSYRLLGDDTLTFLQGQLTQDMTIIQSNHCHYGAFCTSKGRMLANFFLRANADANDYILRLHERQADTVIKRLQMFIMRSAVTIEHLAVTHVGLNQTAARQLCDTYEQTLPEAFCSVTLADEAVLSALPNRLFELSLPVDSPVNNTLDTIEESIDDIEALRLSGGHFHILPETTETLLPQQTPLEAWGGINYQKGCYVGQEIIARNKYLGKVKKGLAYAAVDGTLTLPCPVLQGDKPVGQLIEVHNGKQHTDCLALLSHNAFNQTVQAGEFETCFTPIIPLSDSTQ